MRIPCGCSWTPGIDLPTTECEQHRDDPTLAHRESSLLTTPAQPLTPPGLTPETCPEREHHGKPFRYCPIKGCGWHEGMAS